MKNIGIFDFRNIGRTIFDLLKKQFNFFINDLQEIKVSRTKMIEKLKELINNLDLTLKF